MNASGVITIVIMVLCGLIFVGIGLSNLRSIEPVGFYSGVKPPRAEELTDVEMWNRRHGQMFLAYGIGIMICWLGCIFNEIVGFIILMGILLGGMIGLVLGHHKLEKMYKKKL